MLLFALALQSASWFVNDTTDNNTGKREASSIQISENFVALERHAALSLDCHDGSARLMLMWPSRIAYGSVPVRVEWGAGASSGSLGAPSSWEIWAYSDGDMAVAPSGTLEQLIAKAPIGHLRLIAFRIGQEVQVSFPTEGMNEAISRVSTVCRKDDGA